MKRRRFIKTSALGAASLSLPFAAKNLFSQKTSLPEAVIIENGEPVDLIKTALLELGGMERFISENDEVVIKPNIGWDRSPELAANTNPEIVAELVKQCLQAVAKRVKIFDRTCNNARRCYRNSQIEEMAKEAGADVGHIRKNKFTTLALNGNILDEWPIYEEYLEADKIINVPIAKHHSLSRVTLGLKNLMGVMGGKRGSIHNNFAQKIADITKPILPTLTIIDAYRILTNNGPQGGNPADVQLTKTLIASPCTVSADYLALDLFGLKLKDVEHIKVAADQGLGIYDLNKLNVNQVKLT